MLNRHRPHARDRLRHASVALFVLASSFALMGDDCGPAVGLSPAYKPPVHLYMKVTRTAGDGVMLEFLEQKWIDAERAKDKSIAIVELPRDYRKNDDKTLVVSRSPALSGDTAAMQKLLARALTAEAWSDGLELARTGQPTFDFTLTVGESTIDVQGTRIEVRQGDKKTKSFVKDPKTIDALVRALEKSSRAKGAGTTTCATIGLAKARCVGDMGADRDALVALRDALVVAPAAK